MNRCFIFNEIELIIFFPCMFGTFCILFKESCLPQSHGETLCYLLEVLMF